MRKGDMPDNVRRAIEELRESDLRSGDTPSLPGLLQRKHVRRQLRIAWPRSARLVLAVALLLVAVFGYGRLTRPAPMSLPREVIALSTWRPMTDVLLDTPGRELLRDATPLGRSIINVNTTGVSR